MKFSDEIKELLLSAPSKALATNDKTGTNINVVPVSSVKIVEDKIWLIDYFFSKTKSNLKNNPNVALVFWSGLKGYQIKGKIAYLTQGDDFETATKWIATIHPNRIVKGLLVLTSQEIFDISINNKRI